MKKSQKINQNGINLLNDDSQKELSLSNGVLRNVLLENLTQILQFSSIKRGEIEWLRLGESGAITVDFFDRKQFDRKEDKLLLFKNINIPSIRVKDPNFQSQTAHFFSIRRLENEDKLKQIELNQKSNINVFDNNGQCQIQHIRFKETSFHHHGDEFQLVIALKNYQNQLFSTFISSPFLVESRKKPFQERAYKEQNISTLYDPFLPSILEKQYNIGGSQIEQIEKQKLIGDDISSLVIYFSAQNIRHKTPENLIIKIQKHIYQTLLGDEKYQQIPQQQERLLILCLKSNSTSFNINRDLAKVSKYMSFLEGPILTFLEKTPIDLPQEFKLIDNIEQLKTAYCKVYSEIAQIKIEIKMDQDKSENQYHQIIEKRGGIPSLEQQQSQQKSQQSINQQEISKNLSKKKSFHYICYDLQIRDIFIKDRLQKIPVQKNTNGHDYLSNDMNMQIEVDHKQKQMATFNHLSQQILDLPLSQQKSTPRSINLEDFEESLQFNSIRKEIDQLNDQNFLSIESSNNSNVQQNKNIANYRIKKPVDDYIKVISTIEYPNLKIQKKYDNQAKKQIGIESSYLQKRKSNLLNLSQKQNNQSFFVDEGIEIQPLKKRKLQNNSTNQRDSERKTSKNEEMKRNLNIFNEEKIISGKIDKLHLSQQQQRQLACYKTLDLQGNTSSTASTINNKIRRISHENLKNNLNTSSSCSVSSNKQDMMLNNSNNPLKRDNNINQSSSSESQNFNQELSSGTQNAIKYSQYNDKNMEIQNDEEAKIHHTIHESKMEVEFLYDRLSLEQSKKKVNTQVKQSYKYYNLQNGYESDYSQINDETDKEENQNSSQFKIGSKYKLQQYLKGYDNDDEFDYNDDKEDDDEMSSGNQSIKNFYKRSSQHRKRQQSQKVFQSQSSLLIRNNNKKDQLCNNKQTYNNNKNQRNPQSQSKSLFENLQQMKQKKRQNQNHQSCINEEKSYALDS